MRGIILAGGTGSRLYPCTKVTNKHLLPVYNKPMIYYPLKTLIDAGIKEIMIISGREHAGDFANLLGAGEEFGVKFTYGVQDKAGGIAEALSLAESFANNEPIVEILGDNLFEDNITEYIESFKKQIQENNKMGARIFLKEVGLKAARRFGVAVVENGIVKFVEEKPQNPKSNLAMTGLCMFDSGIFDVIKTLKPSARGELEITDAIDYYVKRGNCYYDKLKGYWSDAGTFESLNRASNLVRKKEVSDDDHWADTNDFADNFKFPSKEDSKETIMEKISQLTKKQAEILDYVLAKEKNKS
ncbi:NTP transferase domain-containing protein [Candidatus Pacearchaeota archaeon]|nr:NTP transferase domain-containing protein [Candidatus Pacearchaeota archaeon]